MNVVVLLKKVDADKNAVETALKIKDDLSGKITVMTIGNAPAKRLDDALAVGVDDAVLLSDKEVDSPDMLMRAAIYAAGIRKLGEFNLILCGDEPPDGGMGQVGPQVAEILNIPHVISVIGIERVNENVLVVKQGIEDGYAMVEIELPALISVKRGMNEPRLATAKGVFEAAGKEIRTIDAQDVEADLKGIGIMSSPTKVSGLMTREEGATRKRGTLEVLDDDSAAKAAKVVVKKLQEWGVI